LRKISNFIVFEFSDKFFHVMLSECLTAPDAKV